MLVERTFVALKPLVRPCSPCANATPPYAAKMAVRYRRWVSPQSTFSIQHSALIVPIEIFFNYVMLNVTLVLFLMSFALPNALFVPIAAPLIWLMNERQRRNERWLDELHQQLVAIVPIVQLINNPPFTRKLVEISEARMLLWSHLPLKRPPHARRGGPDNPSLTGRTGDN